jgi:hypothetical protein
MGFSRCENTSGSHRCNRSLLEDQLQGELDLARRVRIGGMQKAGRHAVLGRKDIDSNGLIRQNELGCVADDPPSCVIWTHLLSRFSKLKDSAISSSFTRSPA